MMNKKRRPYDDILNFLNSYPDWGRRLAKDFNVSVKWDGDYFLLKYNDLWAPFEHPHVRESRGSIFRWDEVQNKYIIVCAPFVKFFNAHEPYADEIDWSTSSATEKIDGSLIKLWFDRDEWHLSTNGSIDAFKAPIDGTEWTFGELFNKICREETGKNWNELPLFKFCTYMFEMTSLVNRVVIAYEEPKIWFLGARDLTTMKESNNLMTPFEKPRLYSITDLASVEELVAKFSKDQEGIVVCDKNFNRIKVKGSEYLAATKLINNGVVTTKRILEMEENGTLDDFISYCPQYGNLVEKVKKTRELIYQDMEKVWKECKIGGWFNLPKKDFYEKVRNFSAFCRGYVLKQYDMWNKKGYLFQSEYFNSQTLKKRSELIESKFEMV